MTRKKEMTRFQNYSGTDLYDAQHNVIIKKNSIFYGRRINETTIWTRDLGKVQVYDTTADTFHVREMGADRDFVPHAKVSVRGGLMMKPTGRSISELMTTWSSIFHRILIPQGDSVLLIPGSREMGGRFRVRYCGETGLLEANGLKLIQPRRPLILRIRHPDGVIVRNHLETTGLPIGYLPYGTFVLVKEKQIPATVSTTPLPWTPQWRLCGEEERWITQHTDSLELVGYATRSMIDSFTPVLIDFSSSPFLGRISTPPEVAQNRCCLCFEKNISSTFVHGSTGHTIACHECAEKALEKDPRCPYCRHPVDRLVLNFFQ